MYRLSQLSSAGNFAFERRSRRAGIRREDSGAVVGYPVERSSHWAGFAPAESPADFMAYYCVNGVASPTFEAEDTAIISMYSRAKPMNMNGSTAITPAIDATVRNRKGKWT
jgi:hypothetical protein